MASSAGAIRAGRAFVELFADDSKLVRGLRSAQKRLQKFGQFTAGIGAKLLGGATALATPFLGAVKAASDLEEVMNKFNVVFGASAEEMKKWSDTTANELGRSKRQIAEFVSGAQDLLVPMGIDPKTAAEASKTLTRLSVDLASFNNKSDADVMNDLQAALTGSSETMKKYGVVANETAVKAELLNQKIDPKNATEAQKAMARLNIILRGTTAAQGDAVRSSGSFANQWKNVKAKMEDAAASVGSALLPTLAKLLGQVAGAITRFGEWASKNQELILTIGKVIAVVAAVGAGLIAAGAIASAFGSILGLLATVLSGVASALGLVISLVGALLSPLGIVIGLVAALSAFFVNWGEIMSAVTGNAATAFEGFKERALDAWGGIRDAIAAGDLSLAFKIVVLALKSEWIRIVGFIKSKWNEWTSFFGNVWTNAVFNASKTMTNAWAGLQSSWWKMTDGLADGWSVFTGFMRKNWNTTVGFLNKAWSKLKSKVTGEKGRSDSDIDRETARANAAVDRKRNAEIMKRERERQAGLSEIERNRAGAIQELEAEVRRREEERARADQADIDANEEKLRQARQELAAAIDEAKRKRKAKEAGDDGSGKASVPGVVSPGEIDLSALGVVGGLQKAAGDKSSVAGTLSAFDRFGGFGKNDESRTWENMDRKLGRIETYTRTSSRLGDRTVPLL